MDDAGQAVRAWLLRSWNSSRGIEARTALCLREGRTEIALFLCTNKERRKGERVREKRVGERGRKREIWWKGRKEIYGGLGGRREEGKDREK